MLCPKCNTENKDNLSFCTGCGTAMTPVKSTGKSVPEPAPKSQEVSDQLPANLCPKCNNENTANLRFCSACGTEMKNVRQVQQTADSFDAAKEKLDAVRKEVNEHLPKVQEESAKLMTKGKEESAQILTKIKGLPKKTIILIAGVLVLVVALIAAGSTVSKVASPENVAKSYVEAKISGDWNTVYEHSALFESEFVNKDSYIKFLSDSRIPGITNFDMYEADYLSTDSVKVFEVWYFIQGDYAPQPEIINLIKTGSKRMLFFDEYKVHTGNLKVYDYQVYVPTDGIAYIDGVRLNYVSERYDDVDLYIIDEMFPGFYMLRIEHPEFDEVSLEMYVDEYSPYFYISGDMIGWHRGRLIWAVEPYLDYENVWQCVLAGDFYNNRWERLDRRTGAVIPGEIDAYGGIFFEEYLYDERNNVYGLHYYVDYDGPFVDLYSYGDFIHNMFSPRDLNRLNLFRKIDSNRINVAVDEWGNTYSDLSDAYVGKYAVAFGAMFVTDFIYDQGGGLIEYRTQLLSVQRDGVWGVVDKHGREVTPFEFEHVVMIDAGTAFAKYQGRYGILDIRNTAATYGIALDIGPEQ